MPELSNNILVKGLTEYFNIMVSKFHNSSSEYPGIWTLERSNERILTSEKGDTIIIFDSSPDFVTKFQVAVFTTVPLNEEMSLHTKYDSYRPYDYYYKALEKYSIEDLYA